MRYFCKVGKMVARMVILGLFSASSVFSSILC